MGILNVTPDSFSDGGLYLSPSAMLERARAMVRDGADIIDIGAESTRPGGAETGEGEELSRLIPAICAVRAEFPDVPISADTRRPSVAARAAEAGADIINDVVSDISGGYPMAKAAAEAGLPLVITHNIRGIQNEGDFLKILSPTCARRFPPRSMRAWSGIALFSTQASGSERRRGRTPSSSRASRNLGRSGFLCCWEFRASRCSLR